MRKTMLTVFVFAAACFVGGCSGLQLNVKATYTYTGDEVATKDK